MILVTYNADFGTGTFSPLAFLYHSSANDTKDAMSYLRIVYLYILPCLKKIKEGTSCISNLLPVIAPAPPLLTLATFNLDFRRAPTASHLA